MGSDKWINLCIQYQEKCLQTSQSFWDSRFWEKWFDSRLPSSRLKVWDSNSFSQNLESKKLCKLFRVFWIQDFKDLSLSLSYVLVPSCFIFFNMYNYIIYIYIYVYVYIYIYTDTYIDITWLIFHPLNVWYYLWLSEDFGGTQQHPAGELRPAQSAPGRLCAGPWKGRDFTEDGRTLGAEHGGNTGQLPGWRTLIYLNYKPIFDLFGIVTP